MPFTAPCFKRHLHARRPPADMTQTYDPQRSVGFHYGRERGVILEDLDDTQLLLISLLNGKHTFEQIVSRLRQHDPNVTAGDVSEALDDLAQQGLIEDTAVELPPDLTPADLERYESQLRFISAIDQSGTQKYEMQARLKRAHVTVLGLGGLGSNVLMGLAAIGVGTLRGVDFDIVETGNLNRQVLYDVADVGKPKALAAAEQLGRFNPEVTFEPVQKRIDSHLDIIDLIRDSDLVAFCADLPPSIHRWMNKAALETGVPFITGGYRGTSAEIGPFVIPFQTACLGCFTAGQEVGDDEIPELAWINEAFWLRHPNIHFLTALAANLVCSEIFKHLTQLGEPATYNHLYTLDIEQFTLTPTLWERAATCPACGQTQKVTSPGAAHMV
jgi:bacteriocin biosynthesis cyclodehydratase domain-containing protein